MTKILIFGDSIAYGASDFENSGWVGKLRNYLDKKSNGDIDTYNLGVSGDNTDDLIKRFVEECQARVKDSIQDEETIYIIFAIGINDSKYLHEEKSMRTSEKEFENNIQKLIDLAKKFTPKIMFIGLTPVDENKTTPIPWNTNKSYKNVDVKKYDEIIQSVCKKNSIPFVEVFSQFSKLDYRKLLFDGLHPNSEGHTEIFKIIKNSIGDLLK